MSVRFHSVEHCPILRLMVLGAALSVLAAAAAPAQEAVQVQPQVANSRFQFSGAINSPDVYVRSGPGEAWYPTMQLPQGTPVTVVGIRFNWLKILPPPGSFCYVSKLFVTAQGSGSVGVVNRSGLNVRAGSDLNEMKTTVLDRLNAGDQVQILGQQDEYYKVAPPPGVCFYVNKQFVNPAHEVKVNPTLLGEATSASAPPVAPAPAPALAATIAPPAVNNAASPAAPTTQPAVAAAPPAPSPTEVAEKGFNKLEADFNAASKQPLENQPDASLAARYAAMMKNPALAATEQETAGFRLAVLKIRLNAQQRLAALNKMEAADALQDRNIQAEQTELQARLNADSYTLYAAVGQLEPSSLQFGAQTLYRLTDPATGHTLIYLRGDDNQATTLMGQFVGVSGQPATDSNLGIRVIPCTRIQAVDPAQVNHKIIANIVPPSLLSHAVQASAGGSE